jgi:heptosyltransferase-2
MTRSPHDLRPVTTGRYRYSKLRWRILVHALDTVGSLAMVAWRSFRPIRPIGTPRRILIVQLDHLGDSVLTSPLINQLQRSYPQAAIDVLASPSNHEVFDADPGVRRVRIAEKTWFERHPSRWSLVRAVIRLGRSLRGEGYDLGIDVRGDVLTVLVLALGGIPRRVGWTMGGGAFLLTDVASWVRGRHEVDSRLALLETLGISPDPDARVEIHVSDQDRITIARWLTEAWPRKVLRRQEVQAALSPSIALKHRREIRPSALSPLPFSEDADWLHAGRFGSSPPLLAVHVGAGTSAKRWPIGHWNALIQRFIRDGWRVTVVGGPEDPPASSIIEPHERLRDWTGRLTVTQTTALLERADLFIGADSGPAHLAASTGILSVVLFSGTNQPRQWRPWSRYSLILRNRVSCQPCHQKICPLAGHPCMSGLEPDRVYRAAKRWWARTHRAESPHNPI